MKGIIGLKEEGTPISFSLLIHNSLATFPVYARNYLRIQTKKGNLVPFEINEIQQLLEEIFDDIQKKKRLLRVVILKARRPGISTWVSGKFYYRTATYPNRYAMIVTHEPEATDFIFKMHKRFQEHLPEALRPDERYNNRRVLEFNNEGGTGLDSAIRVGTAGKEDFGSSQLIHYLHLCMHPDTPILLINGSERLLRDVVIGDSLVTHNGNYGRVSHISHKDSSQMPNGNKALKVSSWLSNYPIIVSPEHKISTNMGWIMAKNLDSKWHFLSMPIRKITSKIKHFDVDIKSKTCPRIGLSSLPTNEDVGYFVGYYLAEGHVKDSNTKFGASAITFALDQDEERFALRAVNVVSDFCKKQPVFKTKPNSKTKTITINNTALAQMIEKLFGRVAGKHIPDWVFDCGEDFCRGLVAGYLSGDGSKTIGGGAQKYGSNSISATSIRDSITYQIRDLVASLGYGWGSISYRKGGVYYGRNCSPAWVVSFNGECGYQLRKLIGIPYVELKEKSFIAKKYYMDLGHRKVWIRIKSIQKTTCNRFMDLEIDHVDHSFRTPNFSVSNSELSKYPRHLCTNLLLSLLQCVPDTIDSAVIIESTGKGVGGEFYDRFYSSRYLYEMYIGKDGRAAWKESINEKAPPENEYTSIFMPWFVFNEYKNPVRPGFERTLDEQMLVDIHGITDEQLQWRRYCIENKCHRDVNLFNQEYPTTARDAFLSSNDSRFDLLKLDALIKLTKLPKSRYDVQFPMGNMVASEQGKLKVWIEPKYGFEYVMAVDVAEGIGGGDWSSIDIINVRTGWQEAQWHGHIAPDLLGVVAYFLGSRYNNALAVVERNQSGISTIDKLLDLKYPNVYVERIIDPPHRPRKRYGWITTKTSKPRIINNLEAELRDNTHGIQCKETFEEMMMYKQFEDGTTGAEHGCFDDRVLSIAIGKYIVSTKRKAIVSNPLIRYNQVVRQQDIPKPSPRAWT